MPTSRERRPAGTSVRSRDGYWYYIGANDVVTIIHEGSFGVPRVGYRYTTLFRDNAIFWRDAGSTFYEEFDACPAMIRRAVRPGDM